MWIENVSAVNVAKGRHHDCGLNSMLIQISDPEHAEFSDPWFPTPAHKFKEIHRFTFLDIDEDDPNAISFDQAKELVQLLQHAFELRMNVVVHCMAGICRSGAVAEVGSMLGFIDADNFKIPNVRVKSLMLKALGLSY
jgi:predicted protein tyrosine phosphatase